MNEERKITRKSEMKINRLPRKKSIGIILNLFI